MPFFNASQAAQYGLFADLLASIFDNTYYVHNVTKASYGAGYISLDQWLSSGSATPPVPAKISYNTVQNALNMYADPNGFNIRGTARGSLFGFSADFSTKVTLTKPDTSQIQITPIGPAIVNLDDSTLSGINHVQAKDVFTFQPGGSETISLSKAVSDTLQITTTNGITDTTGTTKTSTELFELSGKLPLSFLELSPKISESVSTAYNTQHAINFSEANQSSTTNTTTFSKSIDVNRLATKLTDGSYTYGDVELIPGQQYVAILDIKQERIRSGITGQFKIYGPSITLHTLSEGGYVTNRFSDYVFPYKMDITKNAADAIKDAIAYGYLTPDPESRNNESTLTPSNFKYQTNPDAIIFTGVSTGVVTSSFTSSTSIQPYITADGSSSSISTVASAFPESASSHAARSSIQSTQDATTYDLQSISQTKLAGQNGIAFDTTTTERLIKTTAVNIIGSGYDNVYVGDLNYTFTKFKNANITAGNGNNNITISENESNNYYSLGDGNNTISLGGTGTGNTVFLGNGTSFITAGSSGTNYIITGSGPSAPVVLNITSDSGFTQVDGWDFSQDSIKFGSNINLENVSLTFDNARQSYDVYVSGKLVANLISNGNFDPNTSTTAVVDTSYYAPVQQFLKPAGLVANLYADALNRVPDTQGLTYWTNALTKGLSVDQFITNIFSSSEFQSLHPDNSQLIAALYHDILGRSPDAAGLSYWLGQLNNHVSTANVVQAFIQGDEYFNLEVGLTGGSSAPAN